MKNYLFSFIIFILRSKKERGKKLVNFGKIRKKGERKRKEKEKEKAKRKGQLIFSGDIPFYFVWLSHINRIVLLTKLISIPFFFCFLSISFFLSFFFFFFFFFVVERERGMKKKREKKKR